MFSESIFCWLIRIKDCDLKETSHCHNFSKHKEIRSTSVLWSVVNKATSQAMLYTIMYTTAKKCLKWSNFSLQGRLGWMIHLRLGGRSIREGLLVLSWADTGKSRGLTTDRSILSILTRRREDSKLCVHPIVSLHGNVLSWSMFVETCIFRFGDL